MNFHRLLTPFFILLMNFSLFAQTDSTAQDKPAPQVHDGKIAYYSSNDHQDRYALIYSKNILLKLNDTQLRQMGDFSYQLFQDVQKQNRQSQEQTQNLNPEPLLSGLKFPATYNGAKNVFIQVCDQEKVVKLSEVAVRHLLIFVDEALQNYRDNLDMLNKKIRRDKDNLEDDIRAAMVDFDELTSGAQPLESAVIGILDNDGLPWLYFQEWNRKVPLFERELKLLHQALYQSYQDSKMEVLKKARSAASSKTPANTTIQFINQDDQSGFYLDSLNLFVQLDENEIRKMYGFSHQEYRFLGQTEPKPTGPITIPSIEPDVAVIPEKQDSVIKPVISAEHLRAKVISGEILLLPSFKENGGPHIYIPEYELAISIAPEQLPQFKAFTNEEIAKLDPQKIQDSQEKSRLTTRFFATNVLPEDLVTQEITPQEARRQPHYKALYNNENELVEFEYTGQSTTADYIGSLTESSAPGWNFLLNQPVLDLPAKNKVKQYTGSDSLIRKTEYIMADESVLATGNFVYGLNGRLVEFRILFHKDGKLSDIQPFIFDPAFNIMKQGWVAKLIYSGTGEPEKLVIMENNGARYYQYLYQPIAKGGNKAYHCDVLDINNERAGEITLEFDGNARLTKLSLFSTDRKIKQYTNYTFSNKKIITETFDAKGNRLSKNYLKP